MGSIPIRWTISGLGFVLTIGWATDAQAQLAVGSSWVRTDESGKGIVMSVEACCSGGLRLVYRVPPMSGQPAMTMSVDSPMDGTEAPTMMGGKASGQTMAIKRVDDHHYSAVLKMNGQLFATYNATVSPDNKTMTVEGMTQAAGTSQKMTETWVRK